ncbi:MAG: PorP/SprF family type IX secretion system membrane protein [Flavobacteriales bacterium]|nr:PorP/SprF family type IX secretion system membrane protein [Flavobacteriales bacterium]
MRRVIGIIVGIVVSFGSAAQEAAHFSQFSDAITIFNPAAVGVFHGSLRMNAHYRTQWSQTSPQPYNTMAASLDLPVLSDVTGNDFFALGGYVIKDDAGVTQTSNFNSGLNLAFGKSFDPDENHFWSAGAKVTYNQKSMTYDGAHWGSQWNQIGFDQSIPGEYAGEASKTYVGVGAGFHYFGTNHSNLKSMFGIAINNLNKPKVEYLNTEYQLSTGTYVHGELEFHSHANNFAVIPRGIMYFQGSQRYFVLGTSFDFVLQEAGNYTGIEKEMTLEFGAFYRVKDAMVFETQFNWAGLGIGISYDVNVSKLNQATNLQGAMELLLHYKLGYKTGLKSNHSNERFDSIH